MQSTDRLSNAALALCLLPVAASIIGFVVVSTKQGWDTVASHFISLTFIGVLGLIPMITGTAALIGGAKGKDKALMAVLIPIGIFGVFLVGGGQ